MHRARRMWQATEPYHGPIYFAPELREECTAAGLKGGWMAYFASRAAPMGPVPAAVVIATFYNFAPAMVRRAIPDAWAFASPDAVLAARDVACDRILRRFLGDALGSPELRAAAELARRATEACAPDGRPLYAGHASLAWPDGGDHLVLWQAVTLLREYRGDGHVAALLTHGIDGCEAQVLMVAAGRVPAEVLRPLRGWTDEDWDAARSRLRERGCLDEDDALTTDGQALHGAVEERTDFLADAPWQQLGDDGCDRLAAAMRPLVERIVAAGAFVSPNPIGLDVPTG